MPRDKKFVRIGQLPGIAAAPVADRLTSTEARELLEASIGDVRLADVYDVCAGDPTARQYVEWDARILVLEATARIHARERRRGIDRSIDELGGRPNRDGGEVSLTKGSPRAPTLEAQRFEVDP